MMSKWIIQGGTAPCKPPHRGGLTLPEPCEAIAFALLGLLDQCLRRAPWLLVDNNRRTKQQQRQNPLIFSGPNGENMGNSYII